MKRRVDCGVERTRGKMEHPGDLKSHRRHDEARRRDSLGQTALADIFCFSQHCVTNSPQSLCVRYFEFRPPGRTGLKPGASAMFPCM